MTTPAPVWRLLALLVHHPLVVAPLLGAVDPDTLGPRALVAALRSLAQGAPAADVLEACRDEQVRTRLWWIVSMRDAEVVRAGRPDAAPAPAPSSTPHEQAVQVLAEIAALGLTA